LADADYLELNKNAAFTIKIVGAAIFFMCYNDLRIKKQTEEVYELLFCTLRGYYRIPI
jgi:hypothetical protein